MSMYEILVEQGIITKPVQDLEFVYTLNLVYALYGRPGAK